MIFRCKIVQKTTKLNENNFNKEKDNKKGVIELSTEAIIILKIMKLQVY